MVSLQNKVDHYIDGNSKVVTQQIRIPIIDFCSPTPKQENLLIIGLNGFA